MAAIAARKKRFKFHKIFMLRDTQLSEVDLGHKPGPLFKLSDRDDFVILQAYSPHAYTQFHAAVAPLLDKAQSATTI